MLVISLWLNRITGALCMVKHILYISPKPQSYLQQFLSVNGRNNLPNTTYFLTFLSITRYVRRKNCTLLETKLNWVFNFSYILDNACYQSYSRTLGQSYKLLTRKTVFGCYYFPFLMFPVKQNLKNKKMTLALKKFTQTKACISGVF